VLYNKFEVGSAIASLVKWKEVRFVGEEQ